MTVQYRVKITLHHANREEAKLMRQMRNMETAVDFEGPDFTEVVEDQLSNGFYTVCLVDGTTYSYPVASIARIARYGAPAE